MSQLTFCWLLNKCYYPNALRAVDIFLVTNGLVCMDQANLFSKGLQNQQCFYRERKIQILLDFTWESHCFILFFWMALGRHQKIFSHFFEILSDKLIEIVLVLFTKKTPQTWQKAFVGFRGDYSGSLTHILHLILMIFLWNQIFGYGWLWSYLIKVCHFNFFSHYYNEVILHIERKRFSFSPLPRKLKSIKVHTVHIEKKSAREQIHCFLVSYRNYCICRILPRK